MANKMKQELLEKMDFLYWHNCLVRLSLDCILPVYRDIGLLLFDEIKFHESLKKIISRDLVTDNSFPVLKDRVLDSLIDELKTEMGERDWENFICFATTIYDSKSPQYMEWFYWKEALKKFLFPKKYNSGFFTVKDGFSFEEKLKNTFNNYPDFSATCFYLDSITDGFSFSDWDRQMLATGNFNFSDDLNDPIIEIDATLAMNSFQLFWEKYILTMTRDDLEIIFNNCNKIHLSNISQERTYIFHEETKDPLFVKIPGNVFLDLKFPTELQRCIQTYFILP